MPGPVDFRKLKHVVGLALRTAANISVTLDHKPGRWLRLQSRSFDVHQIECKVCKLKGRVKIGTSGVRYDGLLFKARCTR
jgi:hypothetical protein